MKPLAPHWRQELGRAPERPLGDRPAPALAPEAGWADLEFGFGSHPDGRVRKRILAMGKAWDTRPGEPVSVVFPDRKDQKAAYRLLSNPKVTMDDILESHRAATVARCRGQPTVLAVQDTTMLNYSGLGDATGGLAPIGGGGAGSVGIPAHATLAVSGAGRGLGLIGIDADFRPGTTEKVDRRRSEPQETCANVGDGTAPSEPNEPESRRWLRSLGLAQQLGRACPGTRVVSVCDREGDIWGMFAAQAEDPEAAGLLVRACASKRRKAADGDQFTDIGQYMDRQPAVGRRSVTIAARGGQRATRGRKAVRARPKRVAEMQLRIARLDIKAPGDSRDTLPLVAVLASETTTPPKGHKPLRWLLLSSDGQPDRHWAERILNRYEGRWAIEEYFKTLKQATRIEDRRLDEADDLRRCLAFDAVIAWRVFDIHKAARAEPERPALDFFEADELQALYIGMKAYNFTKVRAPPFDTLNIRDAAIDIGRYVGFIPSRRQPLPGTEKLRKGMKYLLQATQIYRATRMHLENPASTMG